MFLHTYAYRHEEHCGGWMDAHTSTTTALHSTLIKKMDGCGHHLYVIGLHVVDALLHCLIPRGVNMRYTSRNAADHCLSNTTA